MNRKNISALRETTRLKPIACSAVTVHYLTELRTKTHKKIKYLKTGNVLLLALLRDKKENLVVQCGDVRDVLLQAIIPGILVRVRVQPRVANHNPEPEPVLVLVWVWPRVKPCLLVFIYVQTLEIVLILLVVFLPITTN